MISDEELIDRVRRALTEHTTTLEPPADLLRRVNGDLAGARRSVRPAGFLIPALGIAVAVVVLIVVLIGHGRSGTGGPVIGPAVPVNHTPVGTVRVVARTADPAGGAPWALRTVRTSRQRACLQIGRLEHGMIGTLGQDGAYFDDGRFHPIPAHLNFPCAGTDINNNLFLNVLEGDVPASGDPDGGHGGCVPGSTCPAADLRNIAFGVLGPDAISVTYALHGHTITEPTGPGGAYIAVLPATTRLCSPGAGGGEGCSIGAGETTTAALQSGLITSVRYRNGSVCRLAVPGLPGSGRPRTVVSAPGTGTVPGVLTAPYAGTPTGAVARSCPAVGYTPFRHDVPHVGAAQVATPITVRTITANHYCYKPQRFGSFQIPCDHRIPNGYKPDTPGASPAIALVNISFIARLAADNRHSVYEFAYARASGPADCTLNTGGTSATTMLPVHSGQRITIQDTQEVCPGTYTGLVTYQPNGGPGQDTLGSQTPIRDHSILVGRFKYVLR